VPPELTLHEAARLAITDPTAPQTLSGARLDEKFAPTKAYAAREQAALQELTRDEQARYYTLDGTPEERRAKLMAERQDKVDEARRAAERDAEHFEQTAPQNILGRKLRDAGWPPAAREDGAA
jgi:hypothetical protein